MKKSLTLFSLVLLLMGLGSSARAVTWTFNFESMDGTMDTWGPESPPVETGAIEYDYQWELTQAEIHVSSGGSPIGWTSFLEDLPPEDVSGFGTETSPPFQLSPININETGIIATLFLNVDGDGMAGGSLGNITFGSLGSGVDVTGVRIAGDFTVTPVPEPTSIALLSLGVLAVLTRRRAR